MARAVTEFSHNTWTKLIMNSVGWNRLQHLQTWANLQPYTDRTKLPELYRGPEYWPRINIHGPYQQYDLNMRRTMSDTGEAGTLSRMLNRAQRGLKPVWKPGWNTDKYFYKLETGMAEEYGQNLQRPRKVDAQGSLLAPTRCSGFPASHFNWKWERLWQKGWEVLL